MSDQKNSIILHNNIVDINANKINKNDWNPNFVPKKIMDSIVDDIRQNGFIGSIIVQRHNKKMNRDYVIINGEHRYEALTKVFGMENIPCTILDCNDKTAKVLSIRLNREHGELAPDRLAALLQDLSVEDEFENLREMTAIEDQELRLYLNLDIDRVFPTEDERLKAIQQIEEDVDKETKKNNKGKQQQPHHDNKPKNRNDKYFYVEWDQFFDFVRKLAHKIERASPYIKYDYIWYIPTGGAVGAFLLSKMLNIPLTDTVTHEGGKILVFDEIYDKGDTFVKYHMQFNKDAYQINDTQFKFCFATMRGAPGQFDDLEINRDIVGVGQMIDTDRYIIFPYDVFGMDNEPLMDRGIVEQ